MAAYTGFQPAMSVEVLEKLRKHLQDLEKGDIIRKSNSEWEFPTTVIQKKNGKIDLCADYRLLNSKMTKTESLKDYTSENGEKVNELLQGKNTFSYFDLGFWYKQVALEESSMQKTAFMTPFGLYEHLRIPFGLKNSQATLRRVVDEVLDDKFKSNMVMLDDCLLFSSDFDQHLKDIKYIFERTRSSNLKIKPETMVMYQSLDLEMKKNIEESVEIPTTENAYSDVEIAPSEQNEMDMLD